MNTNGLPKGSRASIMPNPGYDSDHPVASYPLVVFIRNLDHPFASAWMFCTSKADADAALTQCRQHGITIEP